MLRKDRDKEFRKEIFNKFDNRCCFEDEETKERCTNIKNLKIFRKDGVIENNKENNILVFCNYHYGVKYYEKTKIKNREMKRMGIRKEKKGYSHLTKEEFIKFLSAIKDPEHLMLFQFMYYIGARVGELTLLKKSSVIFGNENYVIFKAETTKRKKEREVNIPENMVVPIKKFMQMKNNIGREDRIFKLTKQRVWQLTKKYAKEAKIEKNLHPHSFRHSYATVIYNATGDLKLVQDLLGHSSMTTTSIYAHVSKKYKKEGVNKAFS